MPPSSNSRLVSVIIPAWNDAPWIEATLRSALDQTYEALEVLVADDGSTDRTADIVERLASADSRLRFLPGTHTGHPGAVRNRALRAARGAFLAFLDADDLWVASKLSDQLAALSARRTADLCVTSARFFSSDTRTPSLLAPLPPPQASPSLRPPDGSPDRAFALLLTRRRTIHTSTVLLARSLLDRVGPFSEHPGLRSGQDDDFIFRSWRRGTPLPLLPVYVHARRRRDSVSAGNSWENVFALVREAEARGDLDPSLASRAWSAAWIVRAERQLRQPPSPWRASLLHAWRLDPLNPRRLAALAAAALPSPLARGFYASLRRSALDESP